MLVSWISVILLTLFLTVITIWADIESINMAKMAQQQELYDDFWTWKIQEFPEFATEIGVHDYDDELESYSLSSYEERLKKCEYFLSRARSLLEESKNQPDDVIFNLQAFIIEVSTYIEGWKFRAFLCPINMFEGIQFEIERLVERMKFENEADYRKFMSRLLALPEKINEIILVLKEGIRVHKTNHLLSMSGVLSHINKIHQVSDAEESIFFTPLKTFPFSITDRQKEDIKSDTKKLINESVLPAFKKLADFIEKDYTRHLRKDISVRSLPDGREFYKQALKFHLSFDINPETLHNLGLKEIARTEREINGLILSMGMGLNFPDFLEKLKQDTSLYYSNERDLIEDYKVLLYCKIQQKIPFVIRNACSTPLTIKAINDRNAYPNKPPTFYIGGSVDGKRPSFFVVKTFNLGDHPKYEMTSHALQKGLPGYHLQASHMVTNENIPMFRRTVERRKISDAPSRFPLNSAYFEGWAMYCLSLGEEMDMYTNLYDKLGRLCNQLWAACCLVIDTGIHAMEWTSDQAITFLIDNTSVPPEVACIEVFRTVTWPGRGCSFKFGELKIKELRRRAQRELGEQFDLREFHDVLLNYGGSLVLLERWVQKYIEKTKTF